MLDKDKSVLAALAVGAVVFSVYTNATPTMADIRVGQPQDADIDASRKMAAWTSAGVVGFVSLITKDPNIFVTGGAMIIALDWWTRHANAVDPRISKASPLSNMQGNLPVATQANDDGAYGYAQDIDSSYVVA